MTAAMNGRYPITSYIVVGMAVLGGIAYIWMAIEMRKGKK